MGLGLLSRKRGKDTTLFLVSMTFEGGLSGEGMVVEGGTESLVFEARVERFLAPTLNEGK